MDNSKSESDSTGHVQECALEFQEKRENNLPLVAFHTVIIASPLLQLPYLGFYMVESTKLIIQV